MKYTREFQVGLAIVLAAVIFFFGVRYFADQPLFGGSYTLYTQFADASGLAPGNSVFVNGVKVGTVDDVELAARRVGAEAHPAGGAHEELIRTRLSGPAARLVVADHQRPVGRPGLGCQAGVVDGLHPVDGPPEPEGLLQGLHLHRLPPAAEAALQSLDPGPEPLVRRVPIGAAGQSVRRRPSAPRAASATRCDVNPRRSRTTGPGADAPNRSSPIRPA